jgi:hypothetical protein
MNDEQIEYLKFLLTKVKVDVFFVENETLIPVLKYQSDYLSNPTDDIPEPVVWLGGSSRGKCCALWCCEVSDFRVIPDIAIWPKEENHDEE